MVKWLELRRVSCQATATDVDHDAVLSFSANTLTGTYGALTLDATSRSEERRVGKEWRSPATEVFSETFTVTVSDGKGGSDQQLVTITVKGTNDAPLI